MKGVSTYRKRLVALVAIIGILVTSGLSYIQYNNERSVLNVALQQDMTERAASLSKEISNNVEALYSIKSLFNAVDNPSYDQFSIEAKSILKRHSTLLYLSWIPYVPQQQRAGFEQTLINRSLHGIFELDDNGKPKSALPRKEYFPILYNEPRNNELAFLGFDAGSNKEERMAMHHAMLTGEIAVSTSYKPVFKQLRTSRVRYFLPVFSQNSTTQAMRMKNLKGYIVGIFSFVDLINASALSHKPKGIELHLIDVNPLDNKTIYVHHSRKGGAANMQTKYQVKLDAIKAVDWALVGYPTTSYMEKYKGSMHWVVLFTGLSLTFLITSYLATLSQYASSVERKVAKRTEALNLANEKLLKLSITDGLTGIANRRHLDDTIGIAWARALRAQQPITLMLIDIDYFKLYNDHYGHAQGDECLIQVAQSLSNVVNRPDDLVARYGGEEFAILLSNDLDAEHVAEKARKQIEQLYIEHAASLVVDHITISVGVCTMSPTSSNKVIQLFTKTDKALYLAKKRGRNQVVIYSDELS